MIRVCCLSLYCCIVFLLLFYVLRQLRPSTSGDTTTAAFLFELAEAPRELFTVVAELLVANCKAALAMAH